MTKPTKWECAPSEDSNQPGHPPSLIRVRCPMKEAWVLSYPLRASEDFDQTGRMPRLIWVFAGLTVILLVLSWGGSYVNASKRCRRNKKQWRPWSDCSLQEQSHLDLHCLLRPVCPKTGLLLLFFFLIWVSLISSRVSHKVGRKREIPEKNHLTRRTWLVSHVTRARLEPKVVRWQAI